MRYGQRDQYQTTHAAPSRQSPASGPLSGDELMHAQGLGCLPPTVSTPCPLRCPPLPQPRPRVASRGQLLPRPATHRFLGMVPDSGAAGVAAGDAPAADAALRALHSLVLGASWGRPSRWPDRTRSRRRARPASGSRSLAPASPAASAMASALCRRPRPLGAGERSLRAAPRATIRCGASRQPPRRLAAGPLRLELHGLCPRPSPPRPAPPPRPRPPPGPCTPRLGAPAVVSRLVPAHPGLAQRGRTRAKPHDTPAADKPVGVASWK